MEYLTNPGFQNGVAEVTGLHCTTVCKTTDSVLNRILQKPGKWIKFPSTTIEMNESKTKWQACFQIPTVISALDCMHVKIKKSNRFVDESKIICFNFGNCI